MIRTETEHTVTLRRPDADTGELVEVDVVVPAGEHVVTDDTDADQAAALEQLWAAGLGVDGDRPQNPDRPTDPGPEAPAEEPAPREKKGKATAEPTTPAGDPGTDQPQEG